MKKTRWFALALAVCLLLGLMSGCGKDTNDARNGVARVLAMYEVKDGLFEGFTTAATGSSFGVGDAWKETDNFVTNRHVVENMTETIDLQELIDASDADITLDDLGVDSRYYEVEYVLTDTYILLDDYACKITADGEVTVDPSRSVPCKVIYQAEADGPDVAILQAANDVPGRVALPLNYAEKGVKVGDTVTAIGFPGESDITALDQYDDQSIYADVTSSTLTTGTVSRFTTMVSEGNTRIIQHEAQINSGNSGGPLVNAGGAVVGINTWGWGDNSQGAIYVDYAIDALDDLHIDYDLEGSMPTTTVIAIAAAAVVLAAVLVIVLVVTGKKKKKEKVPVTVGAGKPAEPAYPQTSNVPPVPAPANPADSGLRIQCTAGALSGQRFMLRTDSQLVLGRDGSRCNVVFPPSTPGVSGQHCAVWVENGKVYVRDLGSSHGTFLPPGMRLSASQSTELHVGDSFFLGSPNETFAVTRKGGI